MKAALIFFLSCSLAGAADHPRSRRYQRPPAPHEPGIWQPPAPARFMFRGQTYATFEAFKGTPAYAEYVSDNQRALLAFDLRLAEKEGRYQQAIEFSRRWHAMPASTQFCTVTRR